MTIQYWHMQMHPDEMEFSEVEYILEHKKIIGLGEWKEKSNQIPQFINDMKVNDIVAIKQGARLIALVQVIGGNYDVNDDSDLDTKWIIHRRPIRVLDWALTERTIPQSRGTLSRCTDPNVETTKIIKEWHKQVEESFTKRKLDLTV